MEYRSNSFLLLLKGDNDRRVVDSSVYSPTLFSFQHWGIPMIRHHIKISSDEADQRFRKITESKFYLKIQKFKKKTKIFFY